MELLLSLLPPDDFIFILDSHRLLKYAQQKQEIEIREPSHFSASSYIRT